MNKFLGIIPARYSSTRFPGKPLADIKGKPMIQLVYEQASKALEEVVVATDDTRIYDAVKGFKGKVVMTSAAHPSGTDRCFEALLNYQKQTGRQFDVVINVQGDEPFIQPRQIEQIKTCFEEKSTDIATLIKKIQTNEVVFDPNKVKVVINKNHEALYFSRSPIPYLRQHDHSSWYAMHDFFLHIGMYAYRSKVLSEITRLDAGKLEQAESLEQLRWLENGFRIKTAETLHESHGIDTPEDLQKALSMGII